MLRMKKKQLNIVFLILFVIVCIVDLFTAFYDIDFYRNLTKPLPILVLTFMYFFTVKKVNYYILISLFISFLADTLLLDKPDNFTPALVLFTIAHLLMIRVVYKSIKQEALKILLFNFLVFLVFFVVILEFVIIDYKQTILIISVYGISICLLVSLAFSNYLSKMNKANFFIFLGAFIHLVSDGIYSVNLFREPMYIFRFMLLITYYIGHYLLYKGFVFKAEEKQKPMIV